MGTSLFMVFVPYIFFHIAAIGSLIDIVKYSSKLFYTHPLLTKYLMLKPMGMVCKWAVFPTPSLICDLEPSCY